MGDRRDVATWRVAGAMLVAALVWAAAGAAVAGAGEGATVAQASAEVGSIRIEGAWARPSAPVSGGGGQSGHGDMGVTSAIYLTLSNTGSAADALVGAATAVARKTELHESRIENGVMRMQPVEQIPLPPGARVELRPGGLHVMLMGLRHQLRPGETVALTLRFQQAGEVTLQVPVRQP